MIRILGVHGVCIRGTFRPLSGADVRESQKPGSPRDEPRGQQAGARGYSRPLPGKTGESMGTRDPNGGPNSRAWVRKPPLSGGTASSPSDTRVWGSRTMPNSSRQWGEGSMNRAGTAGDRETVGCSDGALGSRAAAQRSQWAVVRA